MQSNLKIFIGCIIVLSLTACTTPSKRSKVAYLDGEVPVQNLAEALSDLKRSQSLQVLDAKATENVEPGKPTYKPTPYTVGMVEAYPLTASLAEKIAENSVEDIAYKERWSEKETKATINSRRAELMKLMNGQTCFALSLEAPKATVEDLKYWYGKLEANGKEYALRFRTEASSTFEALHAWEQKSHKFSTADFYGRLAHRREVVACAAAKIDLTKAFKLVFEPRFERDIQRAELEWVSPTRQVYVQ